MPASSGTASELPAFFGPAITRNWPRSGWWMIHSSRTLNVLNAAWSSQYLVDTRASWPMLSLKTLGAYASNMAMASSPIVKRFNVLGDVLGCARTIVVDVLFDPFFFQTAEE